MGKTEELQTGVIRKYKMNIQEDEFQSLLAVYACWFEMMKKNPNEQGKFLDEMKVRIKKNRKMNKGLRWVKKNQEHALLLTEAMKVLFSKGKTSKKKAKKKEERFCKCCGALKGTTEVDRAGFVKGTYHLYLATNHWRYTRGRKMQQEPTCQSCKKCKAEEVHHLRYSDNQGNRILYNEKMTDLLSLCKDCHRKLHSK
jgi:hypothetical protein